MCYFLYWKRRLATEADTRPATVPNRAVAGTPLTCASLLVKTTKTLASVVTCSINGGA